MTRQIHTGYWYVPTPESTRGGQHVGTPRGVLVYDEDLQMGVLSFSERSQFKNVADAGALLDLAAETKPGARRSADLNGVDRDHIRGYLDECRESHADGDAPVPSIEFLAILDRLTRGAGQ